MTERSKPLQNKSTKKSNPYWRWFWLSILGISVYFAWYSFYPSSNDIKWVNDIYSIQNASKETNKYTLLFFTATWCSPCKIMKREVFADSNVESVINSEYTPYEIDIDDPGAIDLVKHFQVQSTPTTVILDLEGNIMHYEIGKIEKEDFLNMLQ